MMVATETTTWLAPLGGAGLFANCTDSELDEIDCLMAEISVPVGARLVQEVQEEQQQQSNW